MGLADWREASRQALQAVADRLMAPPEDSKAELHRLLGSYKAARVFAAFPRWREAARAAAGLQIARLITDPADPRLLDVPPEVETSPSWRPFGNRDIITLYRATWILSGLRALGHDVGALERKILAAQDPTSGGFPNAFGEFPFRSFGVNPTFLVLYALLDGRPWDALSPAAQGAVRSGAGFLLRILEQPRASDGTFTPAVDEDGRAIVEDHPRFDRELFFLSRVRTREPIEHVWLVAGPAMGAARWARALADAGEADGPDFRAAVDLALASIDAALACERPLENLSVGKLICAALDLLALRAPEVTRRRDALAAAVRQAADFLSREGLVRDGGRTRWYWEKYHPKQGGRPAGNACPERMTAGVMDYSVEIGYWLALAAEGIES